MIKKISIIIPIYNEQNNITSLIEEIRVALKNKINYEIIVVNDGSDDNTLKVLQTIRKSITVISHKKKYGQSIGLKTGIINAKNEYIITLDGDGQNDPIDILKLIKYFDERVDFMMVIGNRVNRIDTRARRIASRLAFQIRKLILNDNTPDTGCALKVFRKKDFLQLPFFNHIHRFLPFLFNSFKGKIVSIPVNHRPRASGISKYSNFQRFLVGINDLYGVIWLRKRSVWPILIKTSKDFKGKEK